MPPAALAPAAPPAYPLHTSADILHFQVPQGVRFITRVRESDLSTTQHCAHTKYRTAQLRIDLNILPDMVHMDYEHIVEMISQSQIGAVLCCAGGDQYACGTGALAAGAPDRREPRDVDRVDHFRDVTGSAPETARAQKPPLRQLTPTRIRREPERRRRSDSHKRRTK